MRNPNIQNLIIFCLVAKHKSTNLVAKLLNMDVSTITRNIKNLEESLELTLMNRSKHFTDLTEEGKKLYKKYQLSISYYEDLLLSTKEIYKEYVVNKEIKLLLPMLGSEVLLTVPFIDLLNETFLEHNFFFDSISAGDITHFPHVAIQKIMNADIMFIPKKLATELTEDFIAVLHFKDPHYLCGSPAYLSKHNITEKNFKKHIMCKVSEPFEKNSFAFMNKYDVRTTVDNSHKLLTLLQQGYGISPIPIVPGRSLLERGKLKILLPQISGDKDWLLARKLHKSKILNDKLIAVSEVIKKYVLDLFTQTQTIIDKVK